MRFYLFFVFILISIVSISPSARLLAGLTHNGTNLQQAWVSVNNLFNRDVFPFLVAEAARIAAAATASTPATRPSASAATLSPKPLLPLDSRSQGNPPTRKETDSAEGGGSFKSDALPSRVSSTEGIYPQV